MTIFPAIISIAGARGEADRWIKLAALAACAVYFVNAHGVPWYRVGADINFTVLASILVALCAKPQLASVGRAGLRRLAEGVRGRRAGTAGAAVTAAAAQKTV